MVWLSLSRFSSQIKNYHLSMFQIKGTVAFRIFFLDASDPKHQSNESSVYEGNSLKTKTKLYKLFSIHCNFNKNAIDLKALCLCFTKTKLSCWEAASVICCIILNYMCWCKLLTLCWNQIVIILYSRRKCSLLVLNAVTTLELQFSRQFLNSSALQS